MTELLVDQLRIMARRYPEAIAYHDLDGDRSITFERWHTDSSRLARGLIAAGLTKGDRVAIYLPSEHIIAWIITYAAVHKAGAVAVPANTRLTPREIGTILGHAEVAAVITCEALAPTLDQARPQLPTLRTTITVDGGPESSPGACSWDEALDHDGDDIQVPVSEGDLADIMYTSGTTGLPKGVAVRHRNAALLPNGEVPWSGHAWLQGSPPFTFAGISFIYNPMKLGMSCLFQARFDTDRWLDHVEHHRPTATFLVPAMARLLTTHPRWPSADLSSLTLVSVGSAPLPPETLLALCDRLPGATVTNSYGMTEAGPAYCAMSREEVLKRIGSVGQPMPPMEVRIVAPGTDDDLPAGEHGEVLIRMPGRHREYYKDPDATAHTWAGGWLHSGDIGYLDDDGFLYIVGRMKEVIIRGGHNVHATDVEAVLYEHPGVLEAAVVGIPHEVLGEDIAAFVVPRPAARLDPEEVSGFCASRLADYKVPRRVHVIDSLPRNATGKVLKAKLLDLLTTTQEDR
ncbi:class I adenylate-forming enzyme family protein [Rhabdothermincola sediminis]|uniref:class I adenylate-forming enzyme family protein n=1 Tax=Rhabdothermincola sediminis TaxID=2751370 RepID=UPI001AA052C8|nr:AMP-binding protein [Rhabdothermincola sediminis]